MIPFVCQGCSRKDHESCSAKVLGRTWCDCQHRPKPEGRK